MAHEWAEELADLALEHHQLTKTPYLMKPRTILTREQMAAGERATSPAPYVGQTRPAGEGRWMRYNGESWEPCDEPGTIRDMMPRFTAERGGITFSVLPSVAKALADYKPTELELLLKKMIVENIAASFDIPIDLLRGDSDD